jgi:hypothetical protein
LRVGTCPVTTRWKIEEFVDRRDPSVRRDAGVLH